jgi:hypothetical protein
VADDAEAARRKCAASMIQWRAISCPATSPLLRIVIV